MLGIEQYGITGLGFLPSHPPLQHLPDIYQPWESLVHQLPALIESHQLRPHINALPCISTDALKSIEDWRRAYVVLAFLTHGYIWQGPLPATRLPPAITVPFLKVCSTLELPPIATFAANSLWNWKTAAAKNDPSDPLHLRSLLSFTGTKDEEWFYMVSTAIEACGARFLHLLLNAAKDAEENRLCDVTTALDTFATELDKLSTLVHRMHDHCDPQVFYHQIRPFLAGSGNMGAAGLPHGVFYDEGDGKGEWRKYRGGSNAQSSLIQFFDIALGVKHRSDGQSTGFHEEMRNYMPGPHAAFLKASAKSIDIRGYVGRNNSDQQLVDAFNRAIKSLSAFRDTHMQLVARYIIIPSRSPPKITTTGQKNLATASSRSTSADNDGLSDLSGTGGTKLIPFLRQTKFETEKTAVFVKT